MISDLDGSLGLQMKGHCFASCARAYKSSRLIACLERTSD